jgi:hypothetical protein
MKPVHEIIKYTHKGITIPVQINYIKKQISLVEINRENLDGVDKKQYIFAARTLSYTKAWLTILDAMKYAVTEANKRLESAIEQEHEEIEENLAKPL